MTRPASILNPSAELLPFAQIRDGVFEDWEALRDSSPRYCDPFFDPHFFIEVERVRPGHALLLKRGEDGLQAVWPLLIRPGRWARPMGAPFADWHAPVLREGSPDTAASLLAEAGVSGMTAIGLAPQSHAAPQSGMERVGVNITDLSEGWDAYLAIQKRYYPKHFKKMRRMTRNAERDFSEVVFNANDTSDEAFDALLDIKAAQFAATGKHNVLAPPWARQLLQSLRNHRSKRLSARLATLSFDGTLGAAEFNLMSDRCMHGWIAGYDPQFSYYSPGYMLQHRLLEAIAGCGISCYDAGCDLDYYKKYYCNYMLPMDRGVLRSGVSRGLMTPAGLFAAAESAAPERLAEIMGKVRRRTDQILAAEPTLTGRARGFVCAARGAREVETPESGKGEAALADS